MGVRRVHAGQRAVGRELLLKDSLAIDDQLAAIEEHVETQGSHGARTLHCICALFSLAARAPCVV